MRRRRPDDEAQQRKMSRNEADGKDPQLQASRENE
jgi:hypothetical protein